MTDETKEGTVIGEVTFKYTKSALCRVVHADGVWGGNTPQGYIQMDFYAEKHQIPESQMYDVVGEAGSSKGILKEKQVVKSGSDRKVEVFGREVEVEVIVSPQVARSLKNWLEERLAKIEAIQEG